MNLWTRKGFWPRERKLRQGFTLIELMVVVAVIAILAAILFPVFAQARATARRASSMSNLKQLSLGFMMYVQDYDGKFPKMGSFPPDVRWPCYAIDYVKSIDLFFSPENRNQYSNDVYDTVKSNGITSCKDQTIDMDKWMAVYYMSVWPDYGFNNQYVGHQKSDYSSYRTGASLAEITAPTETIMMASTNFDAWNSYGIHYMNPPSMWPAWAGAGLPPYPDYFGKVSPRYAGGTAVVSFVDGHVKAMKIGQLRGSGTTTEELDALWDLK